ncbi:QRIC2 protein, partial [Serilophus lunatus]|nr:QRIC2 protein [Serilophus lunatus]
HCPSRPGETKPAPAPIFLARTVMEETKSQLKKLEEQQEVKNTMIEEMVTETANQMKAQVRSFWEHSHHLPSRWRDPGNVQEEQEETEEGDCSNCTFNIKTFLGDILQRCEKLQEQVNSLECHQTKVGKLEHFLRQRKQDQELLHHMEFTVSKIQGDCEELSFVSGNLQKDCDQKQKAIE